MAQQRSKADDTKPADDTPPNEDTVAAADHQAALDRIAELEAQLADAKAPVTLVTTTPIAAPPAQLPVPTDLPAGFVFNTVTGQQWCGACAVRPLELGATSWMCEHGSWQAETQTFTPDAV